MSLYLNLDERITIYDKNNIDNSLTMNFFPYSYCNQYYTQQIVLHNLQINKNPLKLIFNNFQELVSDFDCISTNCATFPAEFKYSENISTQLKIQQKITMCLKIGTKEYWIIVKEEGTFERIDNKTTDDYGAEHTKCTYIMTNYTVDNSTEELK